jgi:hypothetical protein
MTRKTAGAASARGIARRATPAAAPTTRKTKATGNMAAFVK